MLEESTIYYVNPFTVGLQRAVSPFGSLRKYGWHLALYVLLLTGHPLVHAQTTVETARLFASDGAFDDFMGWAVAVDGDTAVISAPLHDHQGVDSGAAYVFVRDGEGWTQQAELLPSDSSSQDHVGQNRIGLDGDTVLLGAHRQPKNGSIGVGAVYVFERRGEEWIETAKLTANDGRPGDQFGVAVELDGNTAVIGANGDENSGGTRGSIYIFVREGNTWTQQARLFSSRYNSGNSGFGERISIDGDTVAVGAYATDFQGFESGSVYIFVREADTWTEQALILPDAGKDFEEFGVVALQGDTLLVGACRCHSPVGEGGSVYVFTRFDGAWTRQQQFSPLNGTFRDGFGVSVALDQNMAVIGSPAGEYTASTGKAHLFSRIGESWSEQQRLLPSGSRAYDKFGARVAIDGESLLIGARGKLGDMDPGSAYVFEVKSVFQVNPGLSDAWYNSATSGQGFFITVWPTTELMFVAWFTYDSERPPDDVTALVGEPGHRWMTAQGGYTGDTANLTINVTRGGTFDSAEPPVTRNPNGDGTMTIEFADCNQALVTYELPALGLAGEIPITRIVGDNIPLCESLAD